MIELRKPIEEGDDFLYPPKIIRLVLHDTSKRTEEEFAQERQHAERELKKIAALYVKAEGNKKMLTSANDRLLRLVLRLNPDTTATEKLIADLGCLISEKDAAKGNLGDEQRERDRAENIGKSVKQLAPFVRAEMLQYPETVFASSPDLDEIRGVDLLKCHPVWDVQVLKLILDIELIQAKSGVADAEEIRNLGRAYQLVMKRIEREFVLSKRWFKDTAKEVTPSVPECSVEQIFDHLAAQKALVDLLTPADPNEKFAALRNFHRAVVVYGQADDVFKEFGAPNAYQAPDIELRRLKFFLLVNTDHGSKYLEVNQAVKYR